MRNADVDHSPLCKHLGVFKEGGTVFLGQESKKGSSKDMDMKPAPASTGNLLLFLSTPSVSNCILAAHQVHYSSTNASLHSHPFLLPGKSLQDKKMINLILQAQKLWQQGSSKE